MNYKNRPGKKIEIRPKIIKMEQPQISIVTPFYNGGKTIKETAISVFNQSYPFFEWIIVDDGSTDEESLKKLEEISKMDARVKIVHQENAGPAVARDYGAKMSLDTSFLLFLDCDDLLDKTMLECCYWTLMTHPQASFTYTAMVNFGDQEFIWDKYLTIEKQLVENLISTCSMIRKNDFFDVGGFGITEKAMYEDWNLWLKLLANGKIPVRISTPLFWYRNQNGGEFARALKNNKRAMKYVEETARTIKKETEIIQFPREGRKYAKVQENTNFVLPQYQKVDKIKILFLFPWMVVGGADYFNLELLKRLDKDKYESIILTTLPSDHPLKDEFDLYATEIYDMAGFLDRIDYLLFTDYIISSRQVDVVVVSNTQYGYYMVPYLKGKYPMIPFIDYIHSVDLRGNHGSFGQYSKDVDRYLTKTYCCNEFTKKQLLLNFQKENVETIYIGTDTEKYDPKKFKIKELKEKYHIPQDKIIVTYLARFSSEKRPLLFVEIAKKLCENCDDYYFLMAGDGPLMEEVQRATCGDNHFQLLGMVENSAFVFAMSDLSVNCSSLEGLALTSYESLAMGVPVVSSDVGGQKELIDSQVGEIVPFTDDLNEKNLYVQKIDEVAHHLERYQKNCRQRIEEKFSVNIMAKRFMEIFPDLIQKEKKKKGFLSDFYIYEIAVQLFHEQYYFICKDYIERKYGVCYLREEARENKPIDSSKILLQSKLEKQNILQEVRFLYRIPKNFKQLIRAILSFGKSILLAIPMAFLILYKMIRNHL